MAVSPGLGHEPLRSESLMANALAWGPAGAVLAAMLEIAAGLAADAVARSFWVAVTLLLTPVAVSVGLGLVAPPPRIADRWGPRHW